MTGQNHFKTKFYPLLICICFSIISCLPNRGTGENALTPPDVFELEGMSIEDMQKKMDLGQYTSRAIVQIYLDRIQRIDTEGPALHAIIELNPDVLAIADSLDIERANHKKRGPLHGIPVLIKDNINTGDRMETSAGSLALSGHFATNDAFLIQKLRKAGAIILGKTNLSEWSNFRSKSSTSGWSSRGGQTRNPYLLNSSPCGSSSGSAVGIAADLCVVAVGTATDGSIACPSSMNGVVGLKPTVGLISRSGIIPISKTQDTPGPIARSVSDAALLLGILAGEDHTDPVTLQSIGKRKQDYTHFLDPNGLKGKRIGVEKTMMQSREGIGLLLQESLENMKMMGATIIEVEFQDRYYALVEAESQVLKYEFKDGINTYLKSANSPIKSLADIIRFNRDHYDLVMHDFGQDLLEEAQATDGLDSEVYKRALAQLLTMRTWLDDLMSNHRLDAFCGVGNGAYGPAAIAGYPSITVPMGTVVELPVGITFFAGPYEESLLLAIAYSFEQVTGKRPVPKYINNL